MQKKYVAIAVILVILGAFVWRQTLPVKVENLPVLQDGDLIFQTMQTGQTLAIMWATESFYSHMGIIKVTPKGYRVVDSAGVLGETPLERWISHGWLERFSVYRFPGLSKSQQQKILQESKKYYGRGYDFHFYFGNDTIYCSELPYLAFRDGLGITLGKLETLADLDYDNYFVDQLMQSRWKRLPYCQDTDFEQCKERMLKQQLISPASIARDSRLEKIFSNYGW